MSDRLPRYRTGDAELDRRLADLLDVLAPQANRDQLFEILVTVARLAQDGADRLDLKITNAALKEMRRAFAVFRPFRRALKVTMFGSARTAHDDPLYAQARGLAAALAAQDWMVVTGAGPGIMEAGMEGAGREASIGVNIRLPFEQGANDIIGSDAKLVEMKYFFTRKLMLIKESDGYAVLPGGFGTLDEAFELFTLLQTGKAEPAPVVLLDVPGGRYWQEWDAFLHSEVASRGLIDEDDFSLFRITDDVAEAVEELLGFYRNFISMRYVGNRLVLRLRARPTDEEMAALADRFADICSSPGFAVVGPSPGEISAHELLDYPRIAFAFDRLQHGRLRQLIDTLNRLDSAPLLQATHPHTAELSAEFDAEPGNTVGDAATVTDRR